MSAAAHPWPLELRLKQPGDVLAVRFDDGAEFELPAEYLRVESPSAEVQGHGIDTKTTVAGKAGIRIAAIEPVGNYAVRLVFADGHDTGIFTWRYLHELGRERPERWRRYLAALTGRGLSRDPAAP